MKYLSLLLFSIYTGLAKAQGVIPSAQEDGDLGSKIRDGEVALSDVPAIIIYLIDLITQIAGTISVIFLIYGGFQLMISGLTEDKEAAKNTIKYAIMGIVVAFLAWVIVNTVQVQLTS
jgi:hypothetical protein